MTLVKLDGSDGFDIDDMVSEDSNAEFIGKISSRVLARATSAPIYVREVVSLVYEAVQRKAI